MAKKKVAKKTEVAPAQMTKRQLSRWQRQKRDERIAAIFVACTIAAVIGIILFGIWHEIIAPPGETVARVGNQNVTLGQVAEDAKYQAKTLDTQIALTQQQLSQIQAQSASDPNASFLLQYGQQQLQQLQLQRLQLGNGQTQLQDLIDQAKYLVMRLWISTFTQKSRIL